MRDAKKNRYGHAVSGVCVTCGMRKPVGHFRFTGPNRRGRSHVCRLCKERERERERSAIALSWVRPWGAS